MLLNGALLVYTHGKLPEHIKNQVNIYHMIHGFYLNTRNIPSLIDHFFLVNHSADKTFALYNATCTLHEFCHWHNDRTINSSY